MERRRKLLEAERKAVARRARTALASSSSEGALDPGGSLTLAAEDAQDQQIQQIATPGRSLAATDAEDQPIATQNRIDHEETLFICQYGCTPAMTTKAKINQPPGMRPRRVEHTPVCVFEDNLALARQNAVLKRLESDAVKVLEAKLQQSSMDLLCSVSTEHGALLAVERERKRLRTAELENIVIAANLKETKTQNKDLQRSLKNKEGELALLGGKVAKAHFELSRQTKATEQNERRLRQSIDSEKEGVIKEAAMRVALEVKYKEKSKEVDGMCKKYEALQIRLGSQVTRVTLDMAHLQRSFEHERMLLLKERLDTEERLDRALADAAHFRHLKNEMAKKKRAAEGKANTSLRRLERAQEAEASLQELQQEYDELHEGLEAACARVAEQGRSSETFEPISTNGCFGAYPWRLRLTIYKWLLRRTPPSAIGLNLVDAAQFLAPGVQIRVPDISTIRKMRQEATLLGEGISAFRIASCQRIVSFGFDETTKFGDGLASANFQLLTKEGDVCDEVLRGAFLIPGGCADQVAAAVETKLFARGRVLLERWQTVHEEKNGRGSWPGPKPSNLGYHRLAKALIMSDTYSAARAAKRLIIDHVAAEVETIGRADGTWDQQTDDEKKEAVRCYVGDCMQHLRNILLDAMAAEAARVLQDELKDSLEAFSSYERMSTDPMQLIRAVYREFHHQGEYAKGKGKDFEHWRHTSRNSAFFLPFERARGGRQDLAFDGAVPIFANRVLATSFLRELVFTPSHSNILEDFLWSTLSCIEMVALTRVLTLWDLVFSMPFRWLCGCSSSMSNWSIYNFGPVFDAIEGLLEQIAADGEVLLDPELDPFAAIAQEQPLFRQWREHVQDEEIQAPDGRTRFKWYSLVLNEARSPENQSNKESTDMTVQLAMAMAVEGLRKLRDPRAAIREWLSSMNGTYSASKITAQEREATIGAHATNDRVESNFGAYDNVIRVFRTISVDAASGIAQQMRMHHLDSRVSYVAHDRRKAKKEVSEEEQAVSSSVGFFNAQLSEAMQESAVEMARQLRKDARVWERSDRREQAEYREMKRAQNLQLQLEALAERGAIAIERFDAYEHRAAQSWQQVQSMLEGMHESLAAQAAYLREQVELRAIGLGWHDLAVPWKQASETPEEAVSRLCMHVRETLLPAEKVRKQQGLVPHEAPLPDFRAKSMKQLGRPTTDSTELANLALCSDEQLQAAINRERDRRAAAGFSDAVQALQPKEAPELDENLQGKRLEICWNYTSTEDGRTKVREHCILSLSVCTTKSMVLSTCRFRSGVLAPSSR